MTSLIGAWELTAIQAEFIDTGERIDMYGPDPSGYLMLTDKRMMVIITRSGRSAPGNDAEAAALFKNMMAYTGEYKAEGGDKFITSVDVAWHPGWVGAIQPRNYKIEGDVLTINTGEMTHPMFPGRRGFGVVVWRRA